MNNCSESHNTKMFNLNLREESIKHHNYKFKKKHTWISISLEYISKYRVLLETSALLLFFTKGCSELSNEIFTSDPNSHANNLLQKHKNSILEIVLLYH